MATLPNERSKPLPRLTIYRALSKQLRKRQQEAHDIVPLILKLDQSIEIDDVEFGQDPPDFIFKIAGTSIGTELTDVNPAIYSKGGFAKKKAFKDWEIEVEANPRPVDTFEWGTFTLRESLASLKAQFQTKVEKVAKWPKFDERWLLLRLAGGSPFSLLVGNSKPAPGKEQEVESHFAKVLAEVFAIFNQPHPFDQIIMFANCDLITFPSAKGTRHRLPIPNPKILSQGATITDEKHLNWTSTIRTVRKSGQNAFVEQE